MPSFELFLETRDLVLEGAVHFRVKPSGIPVPEAYVELFRPDQVVTTLV